MSRTYLKASKLRHVIGGISISAAILVLSGCGIDTIAPPVASTSALVQTGVAMGGNQAITSATVTLWKAGTSGYGQGATKLTATTTSPTGSFSFSGYTCSSGDMLYMTVYGGSANAGVGTNSALGLMAALGECTAAQALTHLIVDEATTTASVFALRQFASTTYGTSGLTTLAASGVPINIGAPASNAVGLKNAFATVNNLVPVTVGYAATSYARTATVNSTLTTVTVAPPSAKIATIANILSSCVNSTDGTGSALSPGCTALFTAVKPSGQTSAPADAVQAALDIAINPTNVGGTSAPPYSLSTASAPFQPALTVAPNDWTLTVQFTSSTVVSPSSNPAIFLYESGGLQVDSAGNIYVLNFTGGNSNTTSPYNNSISEFGPDGTPIAVYLNGSITYPNSFVLDPNNTIWVGEKFSADVKKYVSSSSVVSVPLKVNSVSSNPGILASDSAGNIFAATLDGKLFEVSGSAASQVGTLPTTISNYMAFDSKLNLWITASATTSTAANQYVDVFPCTPGTGTACTASTTNTYGTPTAFTAFPTVNSATGFPAGIAFDNSDNAFITATTYYAPGTATAGYGCEFALTLASEATSATPGCSTNGLAGLNKPAQAEVDGAGSVWVVDQSANTSFGQPISGISYNAGTFTSVSGAKGYPSAPTGTTLLQLDQSGNVWTAPYQIGGSGTITEVVGVVAPVYAPISLALKNGSLGKSPQ